MTPRFTLHGGNELAQTLRSMTTSMSKSAMREVLKDIAEPMRGSMALKAPKGPDAPHIADNIAISVTSKVEGQSLDDYQAAVAVGPTKAYFYGLMWEYGWVHHLSAHPFARPAFDEQAPRALTALVPRLWTILASKGVSRSISSPTVVSPGAGGGGLL